jgi:two-component system sensor histidine kinase YesM
LIPKLILQPLIENVVEHGMGDWAVTIEVATSLVEDDLYIYIKDDGVGIPPDRLAEIERNLDSANGPNTMVERFDERKKGYALKNIHQRIRLLYGEPYGLYFEHPEQGVSLFLKIPFQWEEGNV